MDCKIIATPHLPTGKVTHLLCGKTTDKLQEALLRHVDELIITRPAQTIESSLQNHADLSVCPLPDKKILLSDSQISLKEKLLSLGFCVIMQKDVRSPYPSDCLLNFVSNEYYSIYNNCIHDYMNYQKNSSLTLNVNQGYIKCSVAPVAKNAIITDDPGIAKEAERHNLQVCFVTKGDIVLPGYAYGFIGGCCGKLSEHTLAFCGSLESHKDHKTIKSFLDRFDIQAINLLDARLTDVGSLIPLTQKKG